MIGSLVVTAVLGAFAPQSPPFVDTGMPEGIVVDSSGAPISGAEIRIEQRARSAFRRAEQHLLAVQPLAPMTSGRDGRFALPLSRDQRRLGAISPEAFALTARKPGYQDWIEPLPQGVFGLLGTRAVLRQPRQSDLATVRIAVPIPGALVRVETFVGQERQFVHDLELAASGKLTVHVPPMPHPAMLQGQPQQPVELRTRAQLLSPGRSSEPKALLPGTELQLEAAATVAPSVTVATADGSPTRQLRGLYRTKAGDHLWFPLSGDAAEDAALTLVHAVAEGFTGARVGDGVLLEPIGSSPHLIRVVDDAGTPFPGAVLRVFPLARLDRDSSPLDAPTRRARTGTDGTWSLPATTSPVLVVAYAPGFRPGLLADPRTAGPHEIRLLPVPHGTLSLRVHSDRGQPISGATASLSDNAYGAGLAAGPMPATDRDGMLRLPQLREGRHRVVVVAEGFVIGDSRFEIAAGEVTEAKLELSEAEDLAVLTVDEDDHLVPFTALERSHDCRVGPLSRWISDSFGRAWIRGIPRDAELRVRTAQGGGGSGGWSPEPDEINRRTVTPSPAVAVLLPPGSLIQRTIWHEGGGGSTSGGRVEGPGADRVILRWTRGEDAELRLGIAQGPPVRIRGDQVLGVGDEDAPIIVDRRNVARRVPLAIRAPEGADLRWLRIEPVSPHYGGKMFSTRNGNMAERAADGQWLLQARDRGSWNCVALLPGCAPVLFPVSEPTDGEEKPIELEFEAAAPVTVRLTLPAAPSADAELSFQVDKVDGGIEVYAQDHAALLTELVPGQPFDLPCPIGLAPGKYRIELSLPTGAGGTQEVQREIEVAGVEPLVVDLGVLGGEEPDEQGKGK